MDRQLGRLAEAVQDVGLAEETAFLLTSDHGMTSWNQTLIPSVTAAISAAGYRPEVVTPGNSPAPDSEVIVVPSAVRYGDITLRGAAATREGRANVRAALEALSPTLLGDVLDQSDLDALRTSQKLGDLVAESQPPYAFALSPPPPGEWRGAHGSRAELPVPLVISGAGFRQGKAPKRPELVDVVPTIAALLGVQPPAQSQGRVWTEALAAAAEPDRQGGPRE